MFSPRIFSEFVHLPIEKLLGKLWFINSMIYSEICEMRDMMLNGGTK
jgi:hypothetical protein